MAEFDPFVESTASAAPAASVASVEAPVVAPAAAVETPVVVDAAPVAPVETKVETPADIPTFLEGLKAKKADEPTKDAAPEAKAEAKPEGEAEPTVEPPVVEEPINYEFKFADVVTPDTEKVAAWTDLAREMRATPEQAQKAVDMFSAAAEAFVRQQQEHQNKVWVDMRAEWRKQCLADPTIGGNNWNEAQGAIADLRDHFVSDYKPTDPRYAKDMAAFDELLRVTGVGDHPVFNKFLYRVGSVLREPRAPAAGANPTPTNGKKPNGSIYTNQT